jgi:hypothetical protein
MRRSVASYPSQIGQYRTKVAIDQTARHHGPLRPDDACRTSGLEATGNSLQFGNAIPKDFDAIRPRLEHKRFEQLRAGNAVSETRIIVRLRDQRGSALSAICHDHMAPEPRQIDRAGQPCRSAADDQYIEFSGFRQRHHRHCSFPENQADG